MSTAHLIGLITFYLAAAGLLSFSGVVLFILVLATQRSSLSLRFQDLLKISRQLVFASLLLPVAIFSLPTKTLMRPHAQVFESGLEKTSSFVSVSILEPVVHTLSTNSRSEFQVKRIELVTVLALLGLGIAFKLFWLSRRLGLLRSLFSESQLIRQIGQVSIYASDQVSSPFSSWFFGENRVVVPFDFLTRSADLKIALQHEFQHHRSLDTRWVIWLEAVRAIFFWNPLIALLISQTDIIQEFACDEFLIGRQKTSPQAYGSCLIRTAESAVHSRLTLVGTASMFGFLGGSILKRRVTMLFQFKPKSSKRTVAAISLLVLSLMTSLAYAAKSAVQMRKVTLQEAQIYAQKTAKLTQIPIEVNDLVLARLNYFIGTTQGRRWVKNGLVRMKDYQKMIDLKIAKHGMPEELIALPLFESGFQNEVISPYKAAGIWQFMAATAQHYDLTVNDQRDERVNPEKETEAAMKYLSYLNNDFHDWRLAIKAYNEGENQVHKMINQLGTQDPWVIEHSESKEDYLSGAIAMMILIRNPELLN